MFIPIAHINQTNTVVNISLWGVQPEEGDTDPFGNTLIPAGNASIGQVYRDGGFITPPPKPLTVDEVVAAVQNHMDGEAKSHGYDNILSLCSYATSTHPIYAAEGQAGVEWRDAVWSACYQLQAEVAAGTKAMPTDHTFTNLLPKMIWPAE